MISDLIEYLNELLSLENASLVRIRSRISLSFSIGIKRTFETAFRKKFTQKKRIEEIITKIDNVYSDTNADLLNSTS